MRRTNTGALRRLPTSPASGEEQVPRRRDVEESSTPRRTLSRITVAPVVMSRSLSARPSRAEKMIGDCTSLRTASAIEAPSLSQRTLAASQADVLFLDARHSRPSVVYRAIVRARTSGWERGIVLLLEASDLAMIPVASSIGATDFVLSTAAPAEVEIRLRSASGQSESAQVGPQGYQPGIQLHWRTHEVSFEGTSISLSLREMQLLSVLMEHAGEVVTADDLSREAWAKARNTGSGLAAAYVCSLRKKLAWFGGRFGIQTIRAVGYRFVM